MKKVFKESHMDHCDALKLVTLRLKEDGISWAVAFKEYMSLTGSSVSSALEVGRHLQRLSNGCVK